jgi:hypothetical protein
MALSFVVIAFSVRFIGTFKPIPLSSCLHPKVLKHLQLAQMVSVFLRILEQSIQQVSLLECLLLHLLLQYLPLEASLYSFSQILKVLWALV